MASASPHTPWCLLFPSASHALPTTVLGWGEQHQTPYNIPCPGRTCLSSQDLPSLTLATIYPTSLTYPTQH